MRYFLILISISLNVHALTEKDVVESVLQNFPLIQEAQLKSEAAKGSTNSAEGAFDSKLVFKSRNRIEDKYDNKYFETSLEKQTAFFGTNLILGHRQGLGNFPAYDGKYYTSGAGELFAGLSVPVLRNFRTDEFRTNLAIKQIEEKQAQLEVQLKKMLYLHKALSLYYKWILETQKLKINKSVFDLAFKRHSMIEKKYKSGDIEKIKVTDNQRVLDKRSGDILRNEIELSRIKAELSVFLIDKQGKFVDIPLETTPEFVLQKEEKALSALDIVNNPQIKILELEIEKLRLDSKFYNQSKLPGLNVELLGAKEMSSNQPYDEDSLQVGVKFDFPLENRKAEGMSVAYKYKELAAEKNKQFLQSEIDRQLNFFVKASLDSKLRWEIISKEYDGTVRMADAEKSRWFQGASDLFVINLREQDVADVEIRRWTALYDFHQYHLDARLFSGRILKE
jgi:outer membrane protein TolC